MDEEELALHIFRVRVPITYNVVVEAPSEEIAKGIAVHRTIGKFEIEGTMGIVEPQFDSMNVDLFDEGVKDECNSAGD